MAPIGRPIVCTEYLARPLGSTIEGILPIAKRRNVGAFSAGGWWPARRRRTCRGIHGTIPTQPLRRRGSTIFCNPTAGRTGSTKYKPFAIWWVSRARRSRPGYGRIMRPKVLIGTVAATAGAAFVGSMASRSSIDSWYTTIRKPAYVPPNVVFPVAWTALYGDIAVTSAVAIDRLREDGRHAQARSLVAALVANLVLNAGWSWLFFGRHKLGLQLSRRRRSRRVVLILRVVSLW